MISSSEVAIPYSKMKASVAEVLKEEGFIKNCRTEGEIPEKNLIVELKYFKRKPVIEGVKKVSKPSCRIYCGSKDIPRIRNGFGTVIMSSPKGILSGEKAREQNVGGEILCYIW